MSDLGKNIKKQRKKRKLNQKELAKIIGVSQTSIAHYEAGTRQPTIETLMSLSKLFDQTIDMLVGNDTESLVPLETKNIPISELVNRFVKYLLIKDEESFLELFKSSVYTQYSVSKMIDDIFKQVMYKIGQLWEQGIASEADEHYATNIVRKVIHYININKVHSLSNRKALLIATGSERHTLGLEMVNTYLTSRGIDTLYLGSNLPIRSIDKAIDEYKPRDVFISVTLADNLNTMEYLVEHLLDKYQGKINVCVGGQGLLSSNKADQLKGVHILKDINDIREFLREE